MANRYQDLAGDKEALKAAMDDTRDLSEFRRYQAVYLRLAHGMNVAQIADMTRYSVSWVKSLHSLYRHQGLDGLRGGNHGGRRREVLSNEQEILVLQEVKKYAEAGQVLIAADIHRRVCALAGREVSLQTTYRILNRHGWRKIMPRPKHPKSDPKAIEEFKKNGQRRSRNIK
ncbi:MAG: transposase [Alphaproteobacteria bacterium]